MMIAILYVYLTLVTLGFVLLTIGDYEGDNLGAFGFVRDVVLNIPLIGRVFKAALVYYRAHAEEDGFMSLQRGFTTYADIRESGAYLKLAVQAYGTCFEFWLGQLYSLSMCFVLTPIVFGLVAWKILPYAYARHFQWDPPPFISR